MYVHNINPILARDAREGGGGRAELNCPRHVQTYLKKEPFIVDLQSFSIFPKFVKKQFCVKTVGFFLSSVTIATSF